MIEHFEKQIETGWLSVLTPLIEDLRFEAILSTLASSKDYEPHISKIFKAFKACSYNDLKIVIIGQDPYPQPKVATGLAFANEEHMLSPSLDIILQELECSVEGFQRHYGFNKSLEHWAKQGILLINAALTVNVNNPGSHHKVWRYFIEELLKDLSEKRTNIIYVLCGKTAQSFMSCIKTNTNYVFKVAHPAADTYADKHLFRGSNIFVNVNTVVHDLYGQYIIW